MIHVCHRFNNPYLLSCNLTETHIQRFIERKTQPKYLTRLQLQQQSSSSSYLDEWIKGTEPERRGKVWRSKEMGGFTLRRFEDVIEWIDNKPRGLAGQACLVQWNYKSMFREEEGEYDEMMQALDRNGWSLLSKLQFPMHENQAENEHPLQHYDSYTSPSIPLSPTLKSAFFGIKKYLLLQLPFLSSSNKTTRYSPQLLFVNDVLSSLFPTHEKKDDLFLQFDSTSSSNLLTLTNLQEEEKPFFTVKTKEGKEANITIAQEFPIRY